MSSKHRTIMLSTFVVALLCASMVTATGGSLRNLNDGELLESPILESSNGQRNLLPVCNVGSPALIHFKAAIDLSTYASADCSFDEMRAIGQEIKYHWEQYVAYNSVLGPIQITTKGQFCPTGVRRKLASNESPPSSSEALVSELGKSSRSSQRQLIQIKSFGYSAGGKCDYCTLDNQDRRLAAVAVPVTFEVDTDQYPREMGFQIFDQSGQKVFDFQSFNARFVKRIFTLDLLAGQQYTLKMLDSYGDGWCCAYGFGGLRIYDGTPWSGKDLIGHFSGEGPFTAKSEKFTVPALGVAARSAGLADPSQVLFPELELGISNWLSYYIQQAHQYNMGSCLSGKNPTIWVDLESAPESSSSSVSC